MKKTKSSSKSGTAKKTGRKSGKDRKTPKKQSKPRSNRLEGIQLPLPEADEAVAS